jgi:ferredoxin
MPPRASADASPPHDDAHTLVVLDGDDTHAITVAHGVSLRRALQNHDLSPHGLVTEWVNCRGQGHCTACRVCIDDGAPEPEQWLDAKLDDADLGRLACMIDVTHDMTVRLVQPV